MDEPFAMLPRSWAGPSYASVTASEFRVAIALFSFAGKGECRPGIDTLVGLTGLHRRTVQRCIRRLQSKGMALLDATPGRANRYRIATGGVAHSLSREVRRPERHPTIPVTRPFTKEPEKRTQEDEARFVAFRESLRFVASQKRL